MKINDFLLYMSRGLYSSVAKTYRANLDENLKNRILKEGLYHFVYDEKIAEKIVQSEYLKPSSGYMKYINSYGTPVACMFLRKTRYR